MGKGGVDGQICASAVEPRNLGAARNAEKAAKHLLSPAGQKALQAWDRAVIFDMDDTLITNQRHFDEADEALAGIYYRLDPMGRPKKVLKDLYAEIDKSLIPEYGFTPERLYRGAQKAGEIIAGRKLRPDETTEIRRAADIAMSVGELLPGVEDTLKALRQARVPILLKTKGCKSKQTEKIIAHRFQRFFGNRIWIGDHKTPETYRQVTEHYRLNRPFMIGNSPSSDTNPAFEAGLDAVLVNPDRSPAFEHAEPTKGVHKAGSAAEAVQLMLDLDALRKRVPAEQHAQPEVTV